MSTSKYPFIPKAYYPAVMFACKLIREHGTFNRAISTAASYYHVDPDEVERHVRARQGAGQRGKTRKYHWYAVAYYRDCCHGDEGVFNYYYMTIDEIYKRVKYTIIKSTSVDNIESRLMPPKDRYWGDGSVYSQDMTFVLKTEEFKTEDEAKSYEWDKDTVIKAMKQKLGGLR